MTQSNKRRKTDWTLIVGSLTIIMALATVIWAGSNINTKAQQAHKFVITNYSLPLEVKQNSKNIDKILNELSMATKDLVRFGTLQIQIYNRINKIDTKLEKAIEEKYKEKQEGR